MATPLPAALARLPGLDLACAAMTARGLALTFAPDGGCTLVAEGIVAQGVRAQLAQATVEIGQVTLDDVRAEVVPASGAPALASFAARHVAVARLQAALPRGAAVPPGPAGDLRLDALAALDGLVHAFVKDALWLIDADVSVPIRGGTIDFNAVDIEHVGPNSLLGVSPAGIYVSGPAGQVRKPVIAFGPSPPPGVTFESGGGFPFARGDRGRLDLLPFLHALLQAPPGEPVAQPADPNLAGALQRTRVAGEVHLGDGVLGRGGHRLELAGRAEGRNRCTIDSPSLAQRVVIGMPALAARAAAFALPDRVLYAASVDAVLEAHLTGADAPPGGPGVIVSVAQATLREVTLAPAA